MRILTYRDPLQKVTRDISYLRKLWIRFFESLARVCYLHANKIISLYENARTQQIKDGADVHLTDIIVNGVNIEKFKTIRRPKSAKIPQVMCLIGRVVPIKDIKNFIYAVNIALKKIPDLEGWVVGPLDEDEEYTDECQKLVNTIGIDQQLKFIGVQDILTLLPKVGVTVLSSISEGMPLVVLESYAAGIPVVVTNVGACRDMVFGQHPEDEAIGPSGAVVQIANPQSIADNCVALLTQQDVWQRASDAAIKRVEQYYDEKIMFSAYRNIYTKYFNGEGDVQDGISTMKEDKVSILKSS